MTNRGYFLYNQYIIEINVLDIISNPYIIVDPDHATYHTRKFTVISIEDKFDTVIVNETYGKLNYKVKKNYTIEDNELAQSYFKYKDLALNAKSYNEINYSYHKNGEIYEKYYLNDDGDKYGEYTSYDTSGKLFTKYYYLENIIHGNFEQYFPNGKVEISCSYNNGKYNDKYIEYNIDQTIKKEITFIDGININEYPPVYWCFANYIIKDTKINFMKLSLSEQELIYKKWYKEEHDIFDKKTSQIFINVGYNTLDLNKISEELTFAKFTFYVNQNTRNKMIPQTMTQIWCETNSSIYYGFHKLYRTIPKKNYIHTIYFGMNGLGCNADDYYTKTHIDNDNNFTLPNLYTPENKKVLEYEFEKVLEVCPNLNRIFICGYNFVCNIDILFSKKFKHIKVYKIYNYEYSNYLNEEN